jgi:hypothetical protein
MKRLLLFAGLAGLALSSATPPSALQSATELVPASDQPPEPSFEPAPLAAAEPSPPLLPPPPPPPPDPTQGVHLVVSIPQQKLYLFENGLLVDTTPVSTGRRGYETPAGTFPILQKKVHHRSSTYDNAPMPFMQRLTWSGVALHAGHIPGYPASHGCIRLPRSFAKKLYGMTNFSTKVTITHERPRTGTQAFALLPGALPYFAEADYELIEQEEQELAAAPVKRAEPRRERVRPAALQQDDQGTDEQAGQTAPQLELEPVEPVFASEDEAGYPPAQ